MRISDWSSDMCSSDLLFCGLSIAVINYRGARSFVRFQTILTVSFLLVVFVTVGVELYFGSSQNMQPLWRSGNGGSWLIGAAWVFGSAPMIFNSFQSVLHTIEERRSEEHTSELQSLMRISYAVFCLKKKTNKQNN